jgi:hypothetical protein
MQVFRRDLTCQIGLVRANSHLLVQPRPTAPLSGLRTERSEQFRGLLVEGHPLTPFGAVNHPGEVGGVADQVFLGGGGRLVVVEPGDDPRGILEGVLVGSQDQGVGSAPTLEGIVPLEPSPRRFWVRRFELAALASCANRELGVPGKRRERPFRDQPLDADAEP